MDDNENEADECHNNYNGGAPANFHRKFVTLKTPSTWH